MAVSQREVAKAENVTFVDLFPPTLALYGKGEPRPGRKMGHVNRISPKRG